MKIIMSLAALLIAINVFPQDTGIKEYQEWKSSSDEYRNFDIGKYFTPDIVRNQLPINFSFNSNYSNNSMNELVSEWNAASKNTTVAGILVSNFSHYVNTRKKITDFSINLSLNENYVSQNSSNKSDTGSSNIYFSDNNNLNITSTNNLGINCINLVYFSKPFYLHYGINGGIFYNYTQNKVNNQSSYADQIPSINQRQKNFSINFTPQIGIGYGRIENVEDARQAIYIANALSKRNILTRNLTNEELFQLSQKISVVKNKRFLDSRLHLTDEISTVDSFFVQNNLLRDNGAAYFTTLYDMWQYGALFSRKSGHDLSLVLYPGYVYNNLIYMPAMNVVYLPHQINLTTDLTYNWERPVKLNWQHSLAAECYLYFIEGKQNDTNFNSVFSNYGKILAARGSYSFGYYPNTRTNFQATVGQQIRRGIFTDNNSYTDYTATFNAGANYYFSPYLSIAGSYGLNYEHYLSKISSINHQKNNYFTTLFNIQLIYSIF